MQAVKPDGEGLALVSGTARLLSAPCPRSRWLTASLPLQGNMVVKTQTHTLRLSHLIMKIYLVTARTTCAVTARCAAVAAAIF